MTGTKSAAWKAVMALAAESIATDTEVRSGRRPLAAVAPWAREVSPDAREAAAVVFALQPGIRPRNADLVRACIEHGFRSGCKGSMPDLERWVCLSRRTIARRLNTAGLPAASTLIRIGAVIRAIRLMLRDPEPEGSVGRAAREVGLREGSELSRFLHHAIGARPSQITDDRPAAIAARFIRHRAAEVV